MKYLVQGITKIFVSNAAVIFTIILLPAFLFTDSIPVFDELMSYLFSHKS